MVKNEGEKEGYQPRHPSRHNAESDEGNNDALEYYEPKTTFQRLSAMSSSKGETDDGAKAQATVNDKAVADHKKMVNDGANAKGNVANRVLQLVDDGSSKGNDLKKSMGGSGQRARALQYLEDGSENDCAPMPPENAASGPRSMQRESQAGAYSSRGLNRRQKPSASAIGVRPLQAEEVRSSSVQNVEAIEEEGAVPRSSSKAGLVEALPVDEEVTPDMEAQPVDLSAKEMKRGKEKAKFYQYMLLLLVCLGLVVGGILAGVLGTRKVDGTLSPTVIPSFAPTGAPSAAPTGSLSLLLEVLPNYTLESLEDSSTPQWNAYVWLSNHPD